MALIFSAEQQPDKQLQSYLGRPAAGAADTMQTAVQPGSASLPAPQQPGRFTDPSQVPAQYRLADGRLDQTKGRIVTENGQWAYDTSAPTRGYWEGGFWVNEGTPLADPSRVKVWEPLGGNGVAGFDWRADPLDIPQGLSGTPTAVRLPDSRVVPRSQAPGAVNGGGVGMPAPQEPGMPAPGTVGTAVRPGGQGAPMSGMFGTPVQPGGQSAPMGGNPFAGLPPASGGAPMFGDGPPRMVGTPAQPGGQGAPIGASPPPLINLGGIQGPASWSPGSDSLVENRLNNLISRDSEYMQRAQTRGLQFANSRGLINTSMAGEAAMAAALDAARPIAAQDAQTMADAGRFNADASNQFARDGNQFVRQTALNEQEGRLTERRMQLQSEIDRVRDERQAAFRRGDMDREAELRREEDRLRRDWQTNENRLDRDSRERERQGNVSDTQRAQGRAAVADYTARYNQQVADILNNANIDSAAKQSLLDKLNSSYRDSVRMVARAYGINFDDLFPGSSTPPAAPPPTAAPPPPVASPAPAPAPSAPAGPPPNLPPFDPWDNSGQGG